MPSDSTEVRAPGRIFVCGDARAADAVRRELCLSGWTVTRDSDELGHHPAATPAGAPGACRLAVSMLVEQSDSIVAALDSMLAGTSVLAVAPDDAVAADLYDHGRRIGIAEWYDAHHRPLCDELDETQMALLAALVAGSTVTEAASAHHMSERTAARRLAAARAAVSARSTRQAAYRLEQRLCELRTGTRPAGVASLTR